MGLWNFKALRIYGILLTVIVSNFPNELNAQQTSEDPDLDAIEAELLKGTTTEEEPVQTKIDSDESTSSKKDIKYSDLKYLAPFSQVSVIQKRFLPKTNRMHLNIGGNYLTNNPFFQGVGLVGRLGFFFTEAIGIEGSFIKLNTNAKQVTQDLNDYHNVKTSVITSSDSYSGFDLVFAPFYGKMTWLDQSIVPFDTYISIGGGSTKTNTGKSASTLHLGLGQTLAITKDFIFRWDLSANNYAVDVESISATTSSSNSNKSNKQQFNDLFLGLGVSFLFPGAKYR